mgnify:FL=1
MTQDPAVVIDHLTVIRGTVRAVDDVSIALAGGGIIGLLGPSGSGKTTLMRALVGTQGLTAGTVTVAGQPAGSAQTRGQVGYMAQVPALYADLSVTENLAYFAALLGVGADRVAEVIEAVDLGDRAQALVRTLSGGETNRASLAVALLNAPPILVLDEPTVGLDPVLRQSLWELFRVLADGGTTVIVSSHVMDEAARCDDLILMREGRILFHGSRSALQAEADEPDIEQAFIHLATRVAS